MVLIVFQIKDVTGGKVAELDGIVTTDEEAVIIEVKTTASEASGLQSKRHDS